MLGNSKVYLVPNKDRTWSAVVSSERPTGKCAEFADEKEYPVQVLYRRTDLNDSNVYEADDCADRDELLRSLDWIGQCCYTVVRLWDFDINSPMSIELMSVLDAAADRRYEQDQISCADLYEAVMEDSENVNDTPISWSFTLDNGLLALVGRNREGSYDFNVWEPEEDGSRGMLYAGGILDAGAEVDSLSSAVACVFKHYSRAALMPEEDVQRPGIEDLIESASAHTNNFRPSSDVKGKEEDNERC